MSLPTVLAANDVVDLQRFSQRGHLSERFLQRVCTQSERDFVENSSKPQSALAAIWAAKETAYKLVTKISGRPVFVHRDFVVMCPEDFDFSAAHTALTVAYRDLILEILANCNLARMSAYCFYELPGAAADHELIAEAMDIETAQSSLGEWQMAEAFTAAESQSIKLQESALVRMLCKQRLAGRLDLDSDSVQIIRERENGDFKPPHVVVQNQRADIDVSLSHHGDWLAWAYAIPANLLPQK